METQGNLTKEELLSEIEQFFPYVARPPYSELFLLEASHVKCEVLKEHISNYSELLLEFKGAIYLYDEMDSFTFKGMQWLLPVFLRIFVEGSNVPGNMYLYINWYFEKLSSATLPSAYHFAWLSHRQISVLIDVLKYISKIFDEDTSLAQSNLLSLKNA